MVIDLANRYVSQKAFWSQVDDTDDKTGIRFCGVIGKLTSPIPEMKFRFIYQGERHDLEASNIFDMADPDIPAEWLDRVVEKIYTPPKGGSGNSQVGYTGYTGGGGRRNGSYYSSGTTGNTNRSPSGQQIDDSDSELLDGWESWDRREARQSGGAAQGPFPREVREGPALQAEKAQREAREAREKEAKENRGASGGQTSFQKNDPPLTKSWSSTGIVESVVKESRDILRLPAPKSAQATDKEDDSLLGKTFAEAGKEVDLAAASAFTQAFMNIGFEDEGEDEGLGEVAPVEILDFSENQLYKDLVEEYGENLAYFYMLVDYGFTNMIGEPELLSRAIREALCTVPGEYQAKLFRSMFRVLDEDVQTSITENGL